MLIVISPAKKLDMESGAPLADFTMPQCLDDAEALVMQLREMDSFELADLMKLSMKLADLNANRFLQWERPFTMDNARQALFAFQGDVYRGMDAASFNAQDIQFAQQHLRILSGLYGVLRPLDLIQAYRLEMGTRLANERGRDLYVFWGERITACLNQSLMAQGDDVLINLASAEYFKSVRIASLQAKVITPVFKEYKRGAYKVVAIHAKRARGLMSRFIIRNHLDTIEAIKDFDDDGYAFHAELSDDDTFVFCRS